jgi:hypothetical protein
MASEPSNDTQEIVNNLVQAGFPRTDIQVVGALVYVGRDAEVSLAASREMLQTDGAREEQYRSTNLISGTLHKICINGSAFTGTFSTALDLAIQNYNDQHLSFSMARTPATDCGATITAVVQTGLDGGVSGFPSAGVPFSTINIGNQTAVHGVNTLAHVITHELGHTIGLRHSDYFDRVISCGGEPASEPEDPIGAILIPGTPSGATVGGSLMNSCFRGSETGKFSSTDIIALQYLYGTPVPPPLDFNIAFQSSSGFLTILGPGAPLPDPSFGPVAATQTSLVVAAGTSPAIARLTTGGYEVAFQGGNGHLWLTGASGTSDTGFAMRPTTSPSITALTTGGYQVAFQASNSILWTTGTAGTLNAGLGMATTTSPAIAGLNGGTYEVAFQANTGELWLLGPSSGGSTGFAMATGTSPAIVGLVTGGFEVVYQASNTVLGVTGTASTSSLGFGVAAGTSPSITGLSTGGFEVAWQAASSSLLWIYGATGTANLGFAMAPGTSPSIAGRSGGGYDLVYQANTGMLRSVGATGTGNLNLGIASGTGPVAN